MKDLCNYIKESLNIQESLYIDEGLKITKDSKVSTKAENINGKRNIPKDEIRQFIPDDEWRDRVFAAIVKKFKDRYNVKDMWSGDINLYEKNRTNSLASLVCSIRNNAYIDFGPNTHLAQKLGDEIFDVIDNVN